MSGPAANGVHEAQNRAAETKVRAERRLGELLDESVVSRGRPSKKSQGETFLPDGVTKMQSHRWQAGIHVPEVEFEEYLQGLLDTDGVNKSPEILINLLRSVQGIQLD